ncbi:DUF4913 domain-containing protein [Pseudarthrobacter raffinosi]|uniref:DUF4913 domain-containing protein n=1 Tax=Pseudarthrobacter raffinosi TaxID=2953651 RepID=UPI0021117A5F|nr:DUF4913 domain-containing protein [Pseudarthrobacter sp. MDT3-28]
MDQPTQGKHRTVSRLTPVGTVQLEKFRNHADPHMRILMDKEGPFKKCAYDGHKPPIPDKAVLPHVVPEAGIFD